MVWFAWLMGILKTVTASMGVVGKVVGAIHDWAIFQAGKQAQSNQDAAAVGAAIKDSDSADLQATQMNEAELDKRLQEKS